MPAQSGISPDSVGHVRSGLVAISLAPCAHRLQRRVQLRVVEGAIKGDHHPANAVIPAHLEPVVAQFADQRRLADDEDRRAAIEPRQMARQHQATS
jgi:hypothetical protein